MRAQRELDPGDVTMTDSPRTFVYCCCGVSRAACRALCLIVDEASGRPTVDLCEFSDVLIASERRVFCATSAQLG